MSPARVVKVKCSSCAANDRCRTAICGPIKSLIFGLCICNGNERFQRLVEEKRFCNNMGWWSGGRGHRQTSGDDQSAKNSHAHLLYTAKCAGSSPHGSSFFDYAVKHFTRRAISTAPTAASSPLLSMPGPLRSIACCSVFTVSTPNITGMPVASCAS